MNQGTWEFGSSCAALSKYGLAAATPFRCRCCRPSLISSVALGAGAAFAVATGAVLVVTAAAVVRVAPVAGALSEVCAGSIVLFLKSAERTLRKSRLNAPP